jgi:UDP-2-acetamido-2,6-beta-L-arabino-hexul-4-ose reductase
MKILVTGANGFIGKNLVAELRNKGYTDILEFNKESDQSLLDLYTSKCDFVFHLAGVNRPQNASEFMKGNFDSISELLKYLSKHKNSAPVLYTSSTQAELQNPYGKSKRAGENLLFNYSKENKVKTLVYRLTNVFGKWCKPNYNSAVATFCYNISRNLEININDRNTELTLCYIDDVLDEFVRAIAGNETRVGEFCCVPNSYKYKLGDLVDKLYDFKNNRDSLVMPSLENRFDQVLYSTFLSYLKEDNFSYKLKKNVDSRGWLSEFIKSDSMGQIFISKTKPGIIRGNHWHHTKVEKFLVIQGTAVIKLRKIGNEELIIYSVKGEVPEVVDIPAGYTHSIQNVGEDELITLFWASEIFSQDRPDTYYLEV